ncbi:MAG: 2-oxo acid dehydrogenase subunit E2 [Firmicutes bacterium]|nr:2-oxo acid dehydrogenase subunit E2 [Bacillota bacterium]
MAAEVRIPRLGLSEAGGRILAWHKREGDPVEVGDVLLELETDKASVEVTAATAGYLGRIAAPEGAVVESGAVVAWITASPDEQVHAGRPSPGPEAPAVSPSPHQGATSGWVRASPYARRRAAELGIALAGVTGSGPGGRVVARDVERLARGSTAGRWREAVARRLQATVEAPEFWVTRTMEVARWIAPLAQHPQVTWTDLFLQALAVSLPAGSPLRPQPRSPSGLQVGLAVATDQGLLLPVLALPSDLPLEAIAERRKALLARARRGQLQDGDLGEPELVFSNLGMFGVDRFMALRDPSAPVAVAVGRVGEGVRVEGGAIRATWLVEVTATVDHRVADGAEAARFLQQVARYLEQGEGARWSQG